MTFRRQLNNVPDQEDSSIMRTLGTMPCLYPQPMQRYSFTLQSRAEERNSIGYYRNARELRCHFSSARHCRLAKRHHTKRQNLSSSSHSMSMAPADVVCIVSDRCTCARLSESE